MLFNYCFYLNVKSRWAEYSLKAKQSFSGNPKGLCSLTATSGLGDGASPLSHVIPAYHVLAWPRKDGLLSQILSSGGNENLDLQVELKKNNRCTTSMLH